MVRREGREKKPAVLSTLFASHPPLPCLLHTSQASRGKSTRSDVMDLEKHVDKRIRVKFAGGREGA